jgi:hypothetical protein
LVGGGAGASTALAGTQYNYLNHQQRTQEQQQLAACGRDAACQQQVSDQWNATSAQQSLAMYCGLPAGSVSPALAEQLADTNPQTAAYDPLLAQAIMQANQSGALLMPTTELDLALVNQNDGEPTSRAYVGPTQAQINALTTGVLGPLFGGAGAGAQLFGFSPQQVAAANQLGAEVIGPATTIATGLNPGAQAELGVAQEEGAAAANASAQVAAVAGQGVSTPYGNAL